MREQPQLFTSLLLDVQLVEVQVGDEQWDYGSLETLLQVVVSLEILTHLAESLQEYLRDVIPVFYLRDTTATMMLRMGLSTRSPS